MEGLTSNSIGLSMCAPQVRISCSKEHLPLLDVKVKVSSVKELLVS